MDCFGFNVYDKPVEQWFDYALKHKIRCLEIDLNTPHSNLARFTPTRIKTLRDFSDQTNVRYSFHTDVDLNLAGNFFSRRKHVKHLYQSLSVANEINATYVTSHLGHFHSPRPWSWKRKRVLDQVVKSIEAILARTPDNQVKIALENAASLPIESDLHQLGDCVDDFAYLFSKLQSDQVGMCLDVGHANTNHGALAYYREFRSTVISVHFHDNHGEKDDHLGIGEGCIDWYALAAELSNESLDTPMISECFQLEPHVAIQRFKDILAERSRPSR